MLSLLLLIVVLSLIAGKKILENYQLTLLTNKSTTVCAGLKISLPDGWKIEKVKSRKTGSLESITYEANINRNLFKIVNVNNQSQLDINCFRPMKIDETSHQIKERLLLEEAVEILKPTKELSDFKNTKFDISSISQKKCAHLEQWDLPTVICNSTLNTSCDKSPEGIKVKDVFICPKEGDKSTGGAFIYEIIKYHQDTTNVESLLNKVFNSILF